MMAGQKGNEMNEITRDYVGAIMMNEVPSSEHYMKWHIEICTVCHEMNTTNFWDEDKRFYGYFASKKEAKQFAKDNALVITQCDSGRIHGCNW